MIQLSVEIQCWHCVLALDIDIGSLGMSVGCWCGCLVWELGVGHGWDVGIEC